jgi:hypothetical protein
MKRRAFIRFAGGAAVSWPLAARAQTKRARIGWFTVAPHPYIDGFRQGLRELGWIEGENFAIEPIYADGHPERLPCKPDRLVVGGAFLSFRASAVPTVEALSLIASERHDVITRQRHALLTAQQRQQHLDPLARPHPGIEPKLIAERTRQDAHAIATPQR